MCLQPVAPPLPRPPLGGLFHGDHPSHYLHHGLEELAHYFSVFLRGVSWSYPMQRK